MPADHDGFRGGHLVFPAGTGLRGRRGDGRTGGLFRDPAAAAAEEVLSSYIEKAKFAKTYILDTRGISSLYAGNGGIIVSF